MNNNALTNSSIQPFGLMESAWRRYRRDFENENDDDTSIKKRTTTGSGVTRGYPSNGFVNITSINSGYEKRENGNGDYDDDDSNRREKQNEEIRRINLSAMCIANIFQMEDKHLPDPLVKIYEQCLITRQENPDDEQNRVTLKVCNYLFKNWHDTRNDLNFMRDIMKIVTTFARKFNGHAIVLDQAIDGCPISKYRVWVTLLRRLGKEARGRSLGELLAQKKYLDRGNGGTGILSFNDGVSANADNLFDPRDFDESASETGGFLTRVMEWPTVSYAKEVAKHLLRTACKLSSTKFSSFEKYGNEFFRESVPSWASQESSETAAASSNGSTKFSNLQLSRESQNTRSRVMKFLLNDTSSMSVSSPNNGRNDESRKGNNGMTMTNRSMSNVSHGGGTLVEQSVKTTSPVTPNTRVTTTTTTATAATIPTNATKRKEEHEDEEYDDLVSVDTLSFVNEYKWAENGTDKLTPLNDGVNVNSNDRSSLAHDGVSEAGAAQGLSAHHDYNTSSAERVAATNDTARINSNDKFGNGSKPSKELGEFEQTFLENENSIADILMHERIKTRDENRNDDDDDDPSAVVVMREHREPAPNRDVIAINAVAETNKDRKQEISSVSSNGGYMATARTPSVSDTTKCDKDSSIASGNAGANESELKREEKSDYDKLFSSDVFLRVADEGTNNDVDETNRRNNEGEEDDDEDDEDNDDDDDDDDDESDDYDKDNDKFYRDNGRIERDPRNVNFRNNDKQFTKTKNDTTLRGDADIVVKSELDDNESYDVRLKKLAKQRQASMSTATVSNEQTNNEPNYNGRGDDNADNEDAAIDEDYEEWI